jgi:hypothetical protein
VNGRALIPSHFNTGELQPKRKEVTTIEAFADGDEAASNAGGIY